MSQVKKLQTGGTTPTPSSPQYTFKINGTTYTKDEQSLRDQFNPIFDKAVASGEAHEKDRDKWIQSFEGNILNNAKNGTYNINSSNGKFYRANYTGEASDASLGLNTDGTTARKTWAGNILSKADKSDAQRTAWLDGAFGNHILQLHSADDAKAKNDAAAKAIADKEAADKAKATGFQGALDQVNRIRQSYGISRYGKNLTDDPNAIFEQYWDKGTSDHDRLKQGSDWMSGQYKALYDPKLDAYKEDLKSHGFDLDEYRNKAAEEWDNSKGMFKKGPTQLMDLERMSNVFGTMKDNSGFFNRAAYDKMLHGNNPVQPGTVPVEQKPLLQQGDLFTQDGKRFFTDKDGKVPMTGWGKDNTLYDSDGTLYTGAHVENDADGPAYLHPLSGSYIQGKKVSGVKMNNYLNALSSNPMNNDALADLQKKKSVMQQAYDKVYGAGNPNWVTDFSDTNDATRSWTSTPLFQSGHVKGALNITDQMEGLKNASVLAYKSSATDDNGNPQVFHAVRLANGKEFNGIIKHDYVGNVTGMTDVHNNPLIDPDLINTLKGVRINTHAVNAHHNVFDFDVTPSDASKSAATAVTNINPTAGLMGMKDGGVIKHQVGGTIPTSVSSNSTPSNKATVTKQVTLGDVGKSISNPDYSLSGSDKAELVALALNLGGVAASFTGAGSVASAGLGAAGSLTQYGAETARHGFKWGDAGNLVMNLGLDAASAVPGLGILGEGSKALRTITKVSKYLIPALQVAGFGRAAGVAMDIATGKKGFSDLNMDDVQALVGGIHSVVGGARGVTQAMGTTKVQSIKLPLKGGDSLDITPDEAQAISNAPDKFKAAQDVALNAAVRAGREDVPELDSKKVLAWTWRKPSSFTKDAPVTSTNTQKVTQLKDINDYQGDGIKNALYRRAINLTALRNPQLAPSDINQQFGLLGDYTKSPISDRSQMPDGTGAFSVVPRPTKLLPQVGGDSQGFGGKDNQATIGDIPDTRRIYGSMFGMRNLDNERSISYNDVRNRLKGLTGTKSSNAQLQSFLNGNYDDGTVAKSVQQQILDATTDPTSKGWLKFSNGGAIKRHQAGGGLYADNTYPTIPFWNGGKTSPSNIAMNVARPATRILPKTRVLSVQPSMSRQPLLTPAPYPALNLGNTGNKLNTTQNALTVNALQPQYSSDTVKLPSIVQPMVAANPAFNSKDVGAVFSDTHTGSGVGNNFHIDPTTLSELGRALYTSHLNQHFDTRVERPLVDAPLEVPISVRGSLAATSMANKQASDVIQNSQQFKTSDGTVQMLGNLQAQTNAGQLRMQGEAQNQQMLEQTRQQAQQAAMQNAGQRTQVANQNRDTLARATQAERAGENQKFQQVNQPMVDFWKDTNYKNYVQSRENRALDTQIAGISEQNKLQMPMQDLQQQMYKVFNDTSLTPAEQNAKYMDLQNRQNWMQGRLTQRMLALRKNPNQTFDNDANYYDYSNASTTLHKDGGQVKLQVQENRSATATSQAIAKQNGESIKEDSDNQTKKTMQAMKDINSLIEMALKGK